MRKGKEGRRRKTRKGSEQGLRKSRKKKKDF